jgi:hypothetical protein
MAFGSGTGSQPRQYFPGGSNAPPPPPPGPGTDGPITTIKNGIIWQKAATGDFDPITGEPIYDWTFVGRADDGSSGAGARGSYQNPALEAAQAALSGFLQAQATADARKLSATQLFESLAPYAINPSQVMQGGQWVPPGFERGGPAQQVAAMQGRGQYTPPVMTAERISPGAMNAPAPVPADVMGLINQLVGSASKGFVA